MQATKVTVLVPVCELEGEYLNLAIANILGWELDPLRPAWEGQVKKGCEYALIRDMAFHKDWSLSGPLLSEFAVSVKPISDAEWEAEEFITHCKARGVDRDGESGYLTAAMRAIVLAEIGPTVEVTRNAS